MCLFFSREYYYFVFLTIPRSHLTCILNCRVSMCKRVNICVNATTAVLISGAAVISTTLNGSKVWCNNWFLRCFLCWFLYQTDDSIDNVINKYFLRKTIQYLYSCCQGGRAGLGQYIRLVAKTLGYLQVHLGVFHGQLAVWWHIIHEHRLTLIRVHPIDYFADLRMRSNLRFCEQVPYTVITLNIFCWPAFADLVLTAHTAAN